MWIWENADKVGGLSEFATALIALLALVIAVVQIRSARKQQREATAYAIYGEQLRLDLQFPDFSKPDLQAIKSAGRLQQYDDYVSHLLYSCENILEISAAGEWRNTVLYGMRPHAEHIRDHVLKYASNYNREIVDMMKRVAQEVSEPDSRRA